MNSNPLYESLFQCFIEKNQFLMESSSIINSSIYSVANDKVLLNKMLSKDMQYFINLRKELKNNKICTNITKIYCLLFNECININNNKTQKEIISTMLKNNLANIINEINIEILKTLEDKNTNTNSNYSKSPEYKTNKKNLKITIKLLFLILVFMLNKYKNIIDNTFDGCVNKRINMKNLKSTKVREELFFLKLIEENLYWINIINAGLFIIFRNLKNNKYRFLINTDTEFISSDENFKNYCFNCFLPLFDIVKKYLSIKLGNKETNFTFCDDSSERNIFNNIINIFEIDNSIFNLFECFVYEFLNDIDSIWKYYDSLNEKSDNNINDNSGILYGFGIYLCQFIKTIVFTRNENISKIDFFNFYFFSYKLMTNYFSKLNIYLYGLFTNISDIIKNDYIIVNPELNLNYLQNLSNSLKDMLFYFMISSFNNDTLKDIYSFNEILLNSIVSHCLMKTILSIYSLLTKGFNLNLIPEILTVLLDNINKYKILLPLKCHFHKELMTHNFLLILDEFLINNEKDLVLYFKSMKIYKNSDMIIYNLFNKFNKVLSCMFNHYNPVSFLYSNHIMNKFSQILSNSGIIIPGLNLHSSHIFLRFINSEKNPLDYKDIPISNIIIKENYNPNFSIELKQNNTCEENNEINFSNVTYNKELKININNKGFVLDDYLDKNTSELFSNISIKDYEFNNVGNKSYLIKNSKGNNLSLIFAKNNGFIEKLGIDENLKENVLNIMENNQYTDKIIYKLIQEKVINPGNENIKVNEYFYNSIKYYDLKFEMNYFEYQEKIKEFLI